MYTIPVPDSKANQSTRETLGEAIYLLMYFIRVCDWKTGMLRSSYDKVIADTGFPERTVKRWMAVLKEAGEISGRRIPDGFIITIDDYAAIASTRKMPAPARTKKSETTNSDRPPVALPSPTKVPEMAPLSAKNGLSEGPLVAPRSAVDGLSNIKQILYQRHVQSTLQNNSSTCVEWNQNPPQSRRGDASPAIGPDQAKQSLAHLTDEERSALFQRAMEDLENDPSPFQQKFVRRNSDNELEPNPRWGPSMIEVRMAEILARGNGC